MNEIRRTNEGGTDVSDMFPDKKKVEFSYQEVTDIIKETAEKIQSADVGQETATALINSEYPNIPIAVTFLSDIHYGSLGTDYERLEKHLEIIKNTPNMYCIFGGDEVDNFSAIKHPQAGIMGNPVSPEIQTRAFMDILSELDEKSKLIAICEGNHNDWLQYAGYDYYNTFMQEIMAPIFPRGGMINMIVNNGQLYRIALNHQFWGRSRINPENAGRRMLEFGYPGADIALYGHDHQAAGSMFDRGGEQKIVVDGGTYKTKDTFGKKLGLGQAGEGGYTILFWNNRKQMELIRDPEIAQWVLLNAIYANEIINDE